jgi:tripartite-type tricarboxylate transporter receptor subunit TctC
MIKALLLSLLLFISNTCYASTVYVVVHSAAGNGADLQARVVAKHLPKHLPTNTSVGVINMPGAGGLTMANWLYNVADPNTNIAFLNVNSDVLMDGILKDPSVRYDITKFKWLFSAEDGDDNVFVLWANNSRGLTSIDKMMVDNDYVIGNPGPNNVQTYILKDIVGVKSKLIFGYKNIITALQINEIDARFGSLLNAKVRFPEWFKEGNQIRPILQVGSPKRHPILPDVPNAREYLKTPTQTRILEYYEKNVRLARLVFASPKMSNETVKMFADAAVKLEKDPEFIKDANKLEMGVDFIQYEETNQLIKDILLTDKELLRLLK